MNAYRLTAAVYSPKSAQTADEADRRATARRERIAGAIRASNDYRESQVATTVAMVNARSRD